MYYSLAMQNTSDINKITLVPQYGEELQAEIKAEPKEINILSVQMILCIIIICSLFAIKFLLPSLFLELSQEYGNYVEDLVLTEDGSIKIIDEE